jgi:hypothetical protein
VTRVVNLYKEPYDVYIGRPGKGKDGYFGNPISCGEECPVCAQTHQLPGDTLVCYKEYLLARTAEDPEFFYHVMNLHDKVLGCFCKPKPCHGDVLVEFIHDQPDLREDA